MAWQFSSDKVDFQIAPFIRYAKAHYTPDPDGGQLIFNGVDTELTQDCLAYGAQSDASFKASDRHTIRVGLYFKNEKTGTDSLTRVFRVDATGTQLSDRPISVPVSQSNTGYVIGGYVQDEWKITDTLTLNVGARYDVAKTFVTETLFSPRAGLVWKPDSATTFHVGYARNFTPPPQELVSSGTLAAFAGTTGAAAVLTSDPVRAEREHGFDVGAQHVIAGRLTVGIDAYYKLKRNLLDEEHFGSTLIQSPFNYAKSFGWGVEFSANYEHGPIEAYVNVARGEQKAKRINSNQFFFDPAELAYINDNYIFTDHSQKWTLSGGGALKLTNTLGKLQPSFDFIYGDGLRAGDPAGIVPNGGKQKPYLQVNFGIAQIFGDKEVDKGFSVRLDVINVFDKIYLIHDGTGVGAGQPEYGPRRAILFGLRKSF